MSRSRQSPLDRILQAREDLKRSGVPSRRDFFRTGGKLVLGGLAGSAGLSVLACETEAGGILTPDRPLLDHGSDGDAPKREVKEIIYPEKHGGANEIGLRNAILEARQVSNSYGKHGAGAVGLTRGAQYSYGESEKLNPNRNPGDYGVSFIPVGSGAKPVLKTTKTAYYIKIHEGDSFENLSIRGPYAGYPTQLLDVPPQRGVLAGWTWHPDGRVSSASDWLLSGVEITGFSGYALQGGTNEASGTNIRIEYCHVHHNGFSKQGDQGHGYGGIYMSHASHCHLDKNVASYNATNGIDTVGNHNVIYDNECHHNGWGQAPNGDKKGITMNGPVIGNLISYNTCYANHGVGIGNGICMGPDDCSDEVLQQRDIEIRANNVYGNGLSGIQLAVGNNAEIVNTNIRHNTSSNNGGWALEFYPESGGSGRIVDVNVHWNTWEYNRYGEGCVSPLPAGSTYFSYNDNTCTYNSPDPDPEPCEPEPPQVICDP